MIRNPFSTTRAAIAQRYARMRAYLNDPATCRKLDRAFDNLGSLAISGTVAAVLFWCGLELGEALADTRQLVAAIGDLSDRLDAIGHAMAGER
jgi:hypothetical protein